jgi:hypothetical protein
MFDKWLHPRLFQRHGRVVNTPTLYAGGPEFDSQPRRMAILTEVFQWFSPVPPGKCPDSTLKLGHDRFLPNPFQFIIYLSYYSMLYSLVTEKASLNTLPTYPACFTSHLHWEAPILPSSNMPCFLPFPSPHFRDLEMKNKGNKQQL